MLKSLAFGVLAAGLMFAPGIASADVQINQQDGFQRSTAVGEGNTAVNDLTQFNRQELNKVQVGNTCHRSSNFQASRQSLIQDAAAGGRFNVAANAGEQFNDQKLNDVKIGACD